MCNMQSDVKPNCLVLLGPTAVGKTALGVKIARKYGLEIISADSRQVYEGLDIGSGKDLKDYSFDETASDGSVTHVEIPYHLIDVATLDMEFNVFDFQTAFYDIFRKNQEGGKLTFVVGGTGMYLDSVIRGYDFVPVPENPELRSELESKSLDELGRMLLELKPDLHNRTDLEEKSRCIRGIEIALFNRSPECAQYKKDHPRPEIVPFVLGTTLERPQQWANVEKRLLERMDEGMVDEIQGLHDRGYSWERLEKLGLEYRYVSFYLEGKIPVKEDMIRELKHEITQFAKRQETWFRGMERKGVKINWLPKDKDLEARFSAAVKLIDENVF